MNNYLNGVVLEDYIKNITVENIQLNYEECRNTKSNIEQEKNSIFQLANAFLSIESMTHKKLQKLCYYAKAWYLALNDENIISEQFEAWVHGAVQPRLFQKYRSYGFDYIPKYLNSEDLPEEFINFANEIFEVYGKYSGNELESMNHQEMPWIKARGNAKAWESCTNIISEGDMKNYYRGLNEQN